MRRDETRWGRGRRRRSLGAVAIEFALILPVFLLLVLGMIEFGWYFFVDLAATNAAREGARVAITYPGDCPNAAATAAGEAAAKSYLQAINVSDVTVKGLCDTVSGDPAFTVEVQIGIPSLTGYNLAPTEINTQAVMRGVAD